MSTVEENSTVSPIMFTLQTQAEITGLPGVAFLRTFVRKRKRDKLVASYIANTRISSVMTSVVDVLVELTGNMSTIPFNINDSNS